MSRGGTQECDILVIGSRGIRGSRPPHQARGPAAGSDGMGVLASSARKCPWDPSVRPGDRWRVNIG